MSEPNQKTRRILISVAVILLGLVSVAVGWLLLVPGGDRPSAIISYLHDFPLLSPAERVYQVSNHDANSWQKIKGKYLYRESSHYVILDEMGSGAVERIWMTGDPITDVGRIQIYTDDHITPTVDMAVAAFFAGKNPPFLFPLVGDASVSSGGYFSYVQFPFAHHIRIATTGLPQYYVVAYRLTANPDPGDGASSQTDNNRRLQLLQAASQTNVPFGEDKPEGGAERQQGHTTMAAGVTNIVTLAGPGAITALKLRLSPDAASAVHQLGLKVQRTGLATPDVNTPLDAFFGSGMGERQVNGLPTGIDASRHLFYSYWPIPYQDGLTISLNNPTSQTLTLDYEVEYNHHDYSTADFARLAYFHADYHSMSPPQDKVDYPVLDASGAGLYVGTTMVISGPVYLQEGSERIFIDGSLTPQIVGVGTEDYFNGGWGFKNGNFSLPTHGNPAGKFGGPQVTAYRWYLSDAVPFGGEIVYGQEHGELGRDLRYSNAPYSYSSVAYYYLRPSPTLSQTDELTFGPSGNQAAHHDQVSGLAWQGQIRGYYNTAQDRISDSGRAIAAGGSISFTIALDPANQGALLRRRLDYTTGFLRGKVSVDGQPAGTWYTAGSDKLRAWRDDEFLLPASLTAGKRSVTIRIDAEADSHAPPGAPAWNEFHYWIFSIKP